MVLGAFILVVIALGFVGAAAVVHLVVTDVMESVREARRRAPKSGHGFEVLPPVVGVAHPGSGGGRP
jgi:hypothetical protein